MNRKKFLKISGLSLLTPFSGKVFSQESSQSENEEREFYEIRKYEIQAGEKSQRFEDYLKKILIPTYNEMGIRPIGAFRPFYGSNGQTVYLLIPYNDFEMFLNVRENGLIANDKLVKETGYTHSFNDPLFLGMSNSLLKAFTGMPQLKTPEMTLNNKSRIFELRIYQSPDKTACKKKIEMFNTGSEISIFKRTGMRPVFLGETLVGENLPSLCYMLAFRNIVELDELWKRFWFDAEWEKLRNKPEYQNLISNRSSIILRPKPYSQI